jgi:uncharacterized protein
LKNHPKYLINRNEACLQHVSSKLMSRRNTVIKIVWGIVIPVMNKTIITTNYLKNIYILLVCLNLSLCFSELNAQKDLENCEWTEYFFPNGNLSSEGCFVNGIPEGIWKSYYKSGNIKSEGLRKLNKLEGVWLFYRDNLSLEKEISYRNDKKEGREIIYYENGNTSIITNWLSGYKEGFEYLYFPEGELQYKIKLKQNKKHGKSVEYAQDGRKIGFTSYKNGLVTSIEKFNRYNNQGEKIGLWKVFHQNENVKEEGPFKQNLKHGVFRFYNQRGDLQDVIRYEFGIKIDNEIDLSNTEVRRTFYENGNKEEETAYKNGLKNGVSRTFNEDGDVVSSAIFKEGIAIGRGIIDFSGNEQGDWKQYNEDGSIKAEGKFENGKRTGKWVFYHSTGWIEQTGFYDKGRLDGKWKWMDESGFIIRSEEYSRGIEDGEFEEYGLNKLLILKGLYKDGMRVGFWMYHVNDHIEEGNYLNGELDGKWIHRYSGGDKMFEGSYSFGQPEGAHKHWYADGTVKISGKYDGGAKHGKWRYFQQNGEIDYIYLFRHDKLWKVDGRRVAKNRDSSRP